VLRLAPVVMLALLILAGCGASKKTAALPLKPGAAAKARLEHRLRAHHYTVTYTPAPRRASYEQTFSVDHVDWTSPHAFSVTVFIFRTPADAAKHREKTARLVGNFPETNKSKLVGSHLFVATADTGSVHCKIVTGKFRCPRSPPIAVADFNKLVAVAEAGPRLRWSTSTTP
jgi:hypothetical protein